jgi:sarcosine oxidase subunit beta
MHDTADAVVIGGGILGASTAHFLAKKGFGQIVLLEQRTLAAVSTGHSAAAIRTFYSNPVTVQLAQRAVEMFSNGEEELGGDCDFRQIGYLALLDEAGTEAGKTVVELQREHGIRIEELTPADLSDRLPMVNLDDISYAILEPDSGFADPKKTTRNLVESASDWGVTAHEGVGARSITLTNGRVSAVETDNGPIQTPVVINAAGGWGRQLGLTIGLNYSFRWSREYDVVLNVPFDTADYPWLTDPQLCVYSRPAGPRQLLVGLGFPKEIEPLDIDNYDTTVDDASRHRVEEKIFQRVPSTREGSFDHGWASMYTISDDWHPLVGPEPEIPGYFACLAGNGHCFKLGPPLGEALADVITGNASKIDITGLRPSRFIEGDYFTSAWGSGNRA